MPRVSSTWAPTSTTSRRAGEPCAIARRDERRRIDGVQRRVVAFRHQRCLREAPDSQCGCELGDSIVGCADRSRPCVTSPWPCCPPAVVTSPTRCSTALALEVAPCLLEQVEGL